MIKMIWKENMRDRNSLLHDVLLYTLNMAVLVMAWQLYACVKKTQSSSWLENSQLQMQEMGDSFIRDKSRLIVSVLTILCVLILAAVVVVVWILVKNSLLSGMGMDGIREAMGYTHVHILMGGLSGQLLRLLCSVLPASGVGILLWKILCANRTMKEITRYVQMQDGIKADVMFRTAGVFWVVVTGIYIIQFCMLCRGSIIKKITQQ